MNPRSPAYKKFIDQVFRTVRHYDMLGQGESVLAGISGGPDSTALLAFLLAIRDQLSLQVGAAHLNHLLRGVESFRDAGFAKKLSENHGIPFFSEQKDVKSYARKRKLSIEDGAREMRYAFLTSIANTHGYSKIAVGHHADDDAELVLMNILRGSGTRGISGIPPARDNLIIRPLIHTAKDEIKQFLKATGQPYMTDSSNRDNRFLRNSVRNRLIPYIKENYNPSIEMTLNRLSTITRDEDQLMEKTAGAFFEKAVVLRATHRIELSIEACMGFHRAIQRRVTRMALKEVKGDLKKITLTHIEDIARLVSASTAGKSVDLPDRVRVYTRNGNLCFKKEAVPLRTLKRKESQKKIG